MARPRSAFDKWRPFLPWLTLGGAIALLFLLRGLSVNIEAVNFHFR